MVNESRENMAPWSNAYVPTAHSWRRGTRERIRSTGEDVSLLSATGEVKGAATMLVGGKEVLGRRHTAARFKATSHEEAGWLALKIERSHVWESQGDNSTEHKQVGLRGNNKTWGSE